ncbi:MAG: acyltransferase [Treponema sp.]|uniref:acyltransferase family protein n=1 Tax=Treponema sp. TaxID=166 RepID=UPI00298E3A02|nr:acyltransferase [Treponema sp.]MCQ2601712.1 acyltransferase [Treponema sp.]
MEKIEVPHDNAFNFLRLICALIVIYEHSVLLSGNDLLPCLGFRVIAVNVFFILSGFWVTQSYLRSVSIKEYVNKRCKKIFPLYITVVILSAILLVFFSKLSAKNYFTNIDFYRYLIANLSTLNFIHPTLPGVFEGLALGGSVNGSLWTIKVELGFYVILPFIIYLTNKVSRNHGGGYGSIVLCIFYVLSVMYEVFMPIITKKSFLPSSLDNQLPAYVSYFVSGMLVVENWGLLFKKINILIIPAFLIFVLCMYFNLPVVSSLFKPITLCLIVMWIAFKFTLFSKIGKKIDYSYSMYLVHYPLIMCFIDSSFFAKNWTLAFLGILGLTFLCSYILEKIMEVFNANCKHSFIQNTNSAN